MTVSNLAVGKAGELRVASELLLRGHLPLLSLVDNGTDIILETGLRIQVKSSHRIRKDSAHDIYAFGFTTGVKQTVRLIPDYDFAVLWAIDSDVFYVIPKDRLTGVSQVRFNISDLHPRGRVSKWHQYRDAWHLIA